MNRKVKLKCPRCGMEIEVMPLTPWDTFKDIFCGNCSKDIDNRVAMEVVKDD